MNELLESIAKTKVEQTLLSLLEGELEPLGFRAVDLDCRLGGRSLIRIFIERIGDNTAQKVSLDDCVAVSRALGPTLETVPDLTGAFDLEVSSPGLDRRLRLRRDFDENQGQAVKLKLVEPLEGVGQAVTGTVIATDSQKLTVGTGGKQVEVPWVKIKQANRIWKTE